MKKKTTPQVVEEFRAVHGWRYFYHLAEYLTMHIRLEIGCPRCGRVFEQLPQHHKNGHGCPKCGDTRRKTTAQAVRDFKKIHGGAYLYHLVIYKGARRKVDIVCEKCDRVFSIRADSHLEGNGCPRCSDNGINPLDPCTLYVIRQSHPDAAKDWIKIGITNKQDFRDRFKAANGIVSEAFETLRFRYRRDARTVEQKILRTFKAERIKAPISFHGSTECFDLKMRRRILQHLEALSIDFEIL